MPTNEIADCNVEPCRKGAFKLAQTELFSEDALSIGLHSAQGFKKK